MFALGKCIMALAAWLAFANLSGATDTQVKLGERFKWEIPVLLSNELEGSIKIRGEGVIECYRGIKLSEIYHVTSGIFYRYLANGIEIGDESGVLTYGLAEVRLKPRYESSFVVYNRRAYRGYVRCIYSESPKGIQVLNIVDLEDYLKGVLPGEIGDRARDEFEAVKAQAVAARTYAIWKLADTSASGLLLPTVADQLYTGYDTEKEFLNLGVEQTKGEILTFRSGPIAAYYHAVCGGQTAPIEKIWPEKQAREYLIGVEDSNFCAWAKTYRWNETYSIDSLKKTFGGYFFSRGGARKEDFTEITDIIFSVDGKSGRVKLMQVITPGGVYREISDKIRWALGRSSSPGAILPSTRFDVEKIIVDDRLESLKIAGTGNGHGVGMCQCGAIGRSRAGEKYDDILHHYYGPVDLIRLY
jgi:stage II sporulation protein D